MTENRFKIGIYSPYDTTTICDNKDGFEHGISDVVDLLNELNDEKEFWKSMCCSQSNFNQILLNELDIAQEQGYEISNPFKRFLEGRGDVE